MTWALRVGSRVRPDRPDGRHRRVADGARDRPRRRRAPGHPDHRQRPDRRRRRVRALGGRDRHRRRGPGHRPVRSAQRGRGQGAHADRSWLVTAAPSRLPRRRRSRPGMASPSTVTPPPGDGYGRHRRRACQPPRATSRRCVPVPAGVHRAVGGGRCGHRPDPRAPARPDRARDDRRLRAALPALDRPAPQGRHAERLVPAAHGGPPGRPADPGLAVHVRPAHRCPGGRGLRRDRVPRAADPARPPRRRLGRRPGGPGAGHRRRHRPTASTPVTEA